MADERELIAEREKMVAELRSRGVNPYANGFAPAHTTAEVIGRFPHIQPPAEADKPADKSAEIVLLSDERFTIAGRIVAHRGFGKAAFVKLRCSATTTKALNSANSFPRIVRSDLTTHFVSQV